MRPDSQLPLWISLLLPTLLKIMMERDRILNLHLNYVIYLTSKGYELMLLSQFKSVQNTSGREHSRAITVGYRFQHGNTCNRAYALKFHSTSSKLASAACSFWKTNDPVQSKQRQKVLVK